MALRPHESEHPATRRFFLVEFFHKDRLVDVSWFSPGPRPQRLEFIALAISCFTLDESSGVFDDDETPQPWRIKAWQEQNPSDLYELSDVAEYFEQRAQTKEQRVRETA